MKRLLLISVPAFVLAALVAAVCVEVWVRATWDPLKGKPGFFISDPARFEKLGPNYDGWFAGVPVRTNRLGFRDTREYDLDKGANDFRILVLGDSVTYGHGSLFEHTYPLLLEQRLKQWRPEVGWQVWNLGVPGYNTAQELSYLLDVGPRFRPDLVVVGFYGNDVVDNHTVHSPSRREIVTSRLMGIVRAHWYSSEWYRRVNAQARLRLFASAEERERLASTEPQENLLATLSQVANLPEQALTNPTPMSPEERATGGCPDDQKEKFSRTKFEQTPGYGPWRATVDELHQLARDGRYRIVFFINSAPHICQGADVFDARASDVLDDYLVGILSDGTPAVSSHDAFTSFRPSQMPLADGHSIGNSNAVKADVLFAFLRANVLPALVDRMTK